MLLHLLFLCLIVAGLCLQLLLLSQVRMLQHLLLVLDFYFNDTLLVLFIVLLTCSISNTIESFLFSFPLLFLLEALLLFGVIAIRNESTSVLLRVILLGKLSSIISQPLVVSSQRIYNAVILRDSSIQFLLLHLPSTISRRADICTANGFPFILSLPFIEIGILDTCRCLIEMTVTLFLCLRQLIQCSLYLGRVLQLLRIILQDLGIVTIQFSLFGDTGMIVRDNLLQFLDGLTPVMDRKRLILYRPAQSFNPCNLITGIMVSLRFYIL